MTQPAPAMGDAPGLMANDVTVTYRNGHTALWNASFEIPRGTVTALVGVNGAGKSTLFKAIMGFVPAASGRYPHSGPHGARGVEGEPCGLCASGRGGRLGFPGSGRGRGDDGPLWPYGRVAPPRAADHAAVDEALRRVNMQDYRHRQIGELSGGQRKRVFLARALAQDGQVILLDEPFTGVDVTDRGADHCPVAGIAGRGPGDAGLHA